MAAGGGMNHYRLAILAVLLGVSTAALAQGTTMAAPDDTKPQQITGCMSAKTRTGGFVLSGVFGKPVTVIGPNYLQVGLGHQVTLTGTWQTNGIAPDTDKVSETKMFVATAVKVMAKQCASPPSAQASPKSSGR